MAARRSEIRYSFIMRYRVIFLFGSVALGCAGAVGLGCSNKTLPDDEAGTDGSTPDGDAVDMGKPDAKEGGTTIPPCPSYPIKGECDPVAQNCAGGKECSVVVDAGTPVTVC